MAIFEQVTGGATGNLKDAKLVAGDVVTTKGYKSAGDGGGATYLIVAAGSITPDEFGDFTLANLAIAVLQDTDADVRKYGATEAADSTLNIQAAIDRENKYFVPFGLSVFCLNLKHKDNTIGVVDGELKMPDNSDHFDSILINDDTTLGNTNIQLSGKGTLNGNAENQTKGPQYLAFFYKCSDCNLAVKTLKANFMPDPYTGPTVPVHPLSPFDFGVPFGEASFVDPIFAAVLFIDGNNNHVSNFDLLNWGREGITHWFCSSSTISDFTAINGTETEDNEYYVPVDFGSINTSAVIVTGSKVNVDESHTAGGQPYLIYEAIATGTLNLVTENYADIARWTLVERDITFDYGYTAARCSGGGSIGNSITNGYAAYCRASSYSADALVTGMHNLFSYHNSFQVGINFGHDGSPASGSVASGLTTINAGWSGALVGANYGISVVGGSKDVTIDGFKIIGAGRAGLNVSSDGDNVIASDGNISWSGAQGVNTFQASINLSNVKSVNNVSADFNVQSGGLLNLSNCADSNGVISSLQIDENTVGRTFDLISRDGKLYTAFRAILGVDASTAIATLAFANLISNDNMVVTFSYSERNTGSASTTDQYLIEETILVSGSGGARTIGVLDTRYAQLRGFRYVWDVPTATLSVYLQDIAGPTDVTATATQNSMMVKAQSNANSALTINIGVDL
ncbi:MAG: hypothetical protein MJK15_03990 [Colwellia sp.]|nr:hypothetical protein [Colwellia sp.]